jgi:hypothetical protein
MKRWVGLGVIADNLIKILVASSLPAPLVKLRWSLSLPAALAAGKTARCSCFFHAGGQTTQYLLARKLNFAPESSLGTWVRSVTVAALCSHRPEHERLRHAISLKTAV